MKLEEQVVSLEIAKKLRGLGCKQDSLFYYGIMHLTKQGKSAIL